MCSLSNTDSQQLNLATSSGFWQHLPSESYPNSASTYMCSLSNTDSQQLNLATSSGFWQQLPSESYPNSASTYTCVLCQTPTVSNSTLLQVADFGNSYHQKANETRPQTCSLSNTDSQQLSPAAGGTWCSGITSAPHAEGPGCNPQSVHACREFHWSTTVSAQTYLLRHGKPSTCPGSLCELAAAAVVILEASAPMSFACVQQAEAPVV